MMKEFFHSLVDKMIKDMAFGPVAACGFEVAEMEGAVGLSLDGVVGRMYEGKDGIGGDAVDDVALFGRVGGVDHHAYIGGEVDIGDDALAVMEPDGHKGTSSRRSHQYSHSRTLQPYWRRARARVQRETEKRRRSKLFHARRQEAHAQRLRFIMEK